MTDFLEFTSQVELLAIIDHSGRAGNVFFSTLFDEHPEVLCCPWLQYGYSYLIDAFDEAEVYSSQEVHKNLTEQSYFRLLYQDLSEANADLIRRFGGDPEARVDRPILRGTFDSIVLAGETIPRREAFLAIYYSLAAGVGRDLSNVRYVLTTDAPSLRAEDVSRGYSGRAIHAMLRDFPDAHCISLVRDPRANFASNRHQYVNQNGSVHGYKPESFISYLLSLFRGRFQFGQGCAFLFWLLYFNETAQTVWRLKRQYSNNFRTVRNEDLNLHFLPTIRSLTEWLDVSMHPRWKDDPYCPTMLGREWKGTGAYNSNYQRNTTGPLANDPDGVARSVTGPNRYVTERWRTRLSLTEIIYVESLLFDELQDLGYEPLYCRKRTLRPFYFLLGILSPFRGELPNTRWLAQVGRGSLRRKLEFLFYLLSLPLAYLASRGCGIVLFCRGRFENPEIKRPK